MAAQDDQREDLMRRLFGLVKPPESGRSGIDAVLRLSDTVEIDFELKSTTVETVTTARDVGPDHLEKWKQRHWLIGFFDAAGTTLRKCHYAPPDKMLPWIREKEEYIRLDFELAALARNVDRACLERLLIRDFGEKDCYTYDDAVKIQKKQFRKEEYLSQQDLPAGYSKNRMVEILAARLYYIIRRGATLNNPHINASYFKDWVPLFATPVTIGASVPPGVATEAQQLLRAAVASALPGGAPAAPST